MKCNNHGVPGNKCPAEKADFQLKIGLGKSRIRRGIEGGDIAGGKRHPGDIGDGGEIARVGKGQGHRLLNGADIVEQWWIAGIVHRSGRRGNYRHPRAGRHITWFVDGGDTGQGEGGVGIDQGGGGDDGHLGIDYGDGGNNEEFLVAGNGGRVDFIGDADGIPGHGDAIAAGTER